MKSALLPSSFLEQIRWNTMVKWGAPLAPFNAWLLLRGIQTLHVRVERQCCTALALAEHLAAHPAVSRVWYPGLASHPQHALARTQMPAFGAMLAFDVETADRALQVVDRLQLVWGVEAFLVPRVRSTDELIAAGEHVLLSKGLLRRGEEIVVLAGRTPHHGTTNVLKVYAIGSEP